MSQKKILFVLGTRPEAIKLAPLILAALKDPRFEVVVCSTGQHQEMIRPIFEFFKINPQYDFQLIKPGQTLHDITGAVLEKTRICVQKEAPDWIVVQGDTTSVMAASLCAFYDKVSVAHVEAGLRTGNMLSPWPEEFNRRVTTLIARLHFAPTSDSAENLYREGVSPDAVTITGNTGIDSLLSVKETLKTDERLQQQFQDQFKFLNPERKLVLVTLHRRESFGETIRGILRGLLLLAQRDDVEILLPLHLNPEVRKAVAEVFGTQSCRVDSESQPNQSKIWIMEPLGYLSFVYAMTRSRFIVSDSGGVQEEAPSLGKPVLVVRDTTERPEAIRAGTSKLIGLSEQSVFLECTKLLDHDDELKKMARVHNPYGDGKASARILDRMAECSSVMGSPLS